MLQKSLCNSTIQMLKRKMKKHNTLWSQLVVCLLARFSLYCGSTSFGCPWGMAGGVFVKRSKSFWLEITAPLYRSVEERCMESVSVSITRNLIPFFFFIFFFFNNWDLFAKLGFQFESLHRILFHDDFSAILFVVSH